ncbi:Ber1p KNAG_0B06290 [Huiozyma naganishii CBS 8797]|uniref:SRR1-like domain-containing protein n=1 Tax=Huiozyma naganishii (strain ATCC MYA-139 / BCRC 22969 / CBS 8797 / KCTC 17520 / NBRC 10181 / NCYC 3082 / Yp74L-3) TaxID=1071383 RepID=J7RHN8_HUIN7|nr:hypothetical protein KNAG_0B06290 [Kazachstania naganishii CBS 8797]CCK69058.1 hypothetical protein KNAG_0B06290 [Kazachstania naganishii CBS 8797]
MSDVGLVKRRLATGHMKSKPFEEVLASFRNIIRDSKMFESLSKQLQPWMRNLTRIRCLAIGSFTEDIPARYQLALLLELSDLIKAETQGNTVSVSLYDPVFNESDLNFIEKMCTDWTVEKEVEGSKEDSESTLFFLPHAPLDLTESVLSREKPMYLLANNIISHTDRYTKVQLYEKYPLMCKLVYFSAPDSLGIGTKAKHDGFSTFIPKRKRKNNKYILKEPEIDFQKVDSYFTTCTVVYDFENGQQLRNQPWVNSFSDLCLHSLW